MGTTDLLWQGFAAEGMSELKEGGQVIYDVVKQWPQSQKIRGLFLLNLRKLCMMAWFSFY